MLCYHLVVVRRWHGMFARLTTARNRRHPVSKDTPDYFLFSFTFRFSRVHARVEIDMPLVECHLSLAMSLHSGCFSASRHHRRTLSAAPDHRHEPCLPSISALHGHLDHHRPYRRNEFANNHFFLAKQKFDRIFFEQSTGRQPSATYELLRLFDRHESRLTLRHDRHLKRQVRSNQGVRCMSHHQT